MSRINTNVQSLTAQRVFGGQEKSLNTTLSRLSTGLRINSAKDDPAGLIASENLRSEKASISAAIGNAERADQVINIAEGGLQEINALLVEMQSLVTSSANEAGLSVEEKKANQLQIDSILESIDRIANSTSFQGAKLLNGTYDFTVSGQHEEIESIQVNAAKTAFGENRDINLLVTESAQHASLFMSLAAGNLDLTNADSNFTFEIIGSKGAHEFTFASGESLDNMVKSINTFTAVTGISATVSGSGLALKSIEYGSKEFVSVGIKDDGGQAGAVYSYEGANENKAVTTPLNDFGTLKGSNNLRDEGQDVGAVVNGIRATSDGKNISVRSDILDVQFQLSDKGATDLTAITSKAFTITGGGAQFNLGPAVDITNQASIGISNVQARNLGDVNAGYLDQLGNSKGANVIDGNLAQAQKIIDSAIAEVSTLRGRLGAFQKNTIGSTINSLNVALENTSAAESQIRDADFANETAEMTRTQILQQSAQKVLSMSNSAPQSVLSLLG